MTKRILIVQLALLGAFAIVLAISFACDSWPLGKEKAVAYIESVMKENEPLFDELDAFLHTNPEIGLIRADDTESFKQQAQALHLAPHQTERIITIMRQGHLNTIWYSKDRYIKFCMQSPHPQQYFTLIRFDPQSNVKDFRGYPYSRTTYTPLSSKGWHLREN